MSPHLRSSALLVGLVAASTPPARRSSWRQSGPCRERSHASDAEALDDLGAGQLARAAGRAAAAWSGVRRSRSIATSMSTHPRRRRAAASRAGRPSGVMPPYSMPDSSTARSIARNDALRTSRVRLTRLLTSARVSARTTQAATRSSPSRRPATTTQLALAVERQVVRRRHRRGVGQLGVDLDDGDLARAAPSRAGRRPPGRATSSGWSSGGQGVQGAEGGDAHGPILPRARPQLLGAAGPGDHVGHDQRTRSRRSRRPPSTRRTQRDVDAEVVGHAGADAGDHPVVAAADEALRLLVVGWAGCGMLIGSPRSGSAGCGRLRSAGLLGGPSRSASRVGGAGVGARPGRGTGRRWFGSVRVALVRSVVRVRWVSSTGPASGRPSSAAGRFPRGRCGGRGQQAGDAGEHPGHRQQPADVVAVRRRRPGSGPRRRPGRGRRCPSRGGRC